MKKRLGFDLILLGDPTSGKDTQAAILTKKFALKPVESGKYWRSLGKKKNLPRLIRLRQIKSLPAPVDLIKSFLKNSLDDPPKNKDLLFVGTPKLKPEAMFLKKQFNIHKRDFLVISMILPIAEIEKRSLKRSRNIDDSKYIKVRVRWHRQQQGKTLKYFQQMKKLRSINANQSVLRVTKDILNAIHDYQGPKRD